MTTKAIILCALPLKESYTEVEMRAYARQCIVHDRRALFSRKEPIMAGGLPDQILKVLKDGPANTREIIQALPSADPNYVSSYLSSLQRRGYVKSQPFTVMNPKKHIRLWTLIDGSF